MAINFPDSPNNGDSFTSNNKTWVFDGTVWNITSGTNSVADGAITTAKIASNAVHQTKLASNLSAITVTTTANRGTDVASPFTGQTIYLSDVKRLQVWDGSAWMFVTNGAPGAPTALSATPLSTTSVSIAFTTGTINGSAVTNYKYAYSSNGGSTYSEFAALDPADITSPVVISGLVGATTYLIKLRAVSDFGDSVDSSPVSVTTLTPPSAPTSLSATGFYLQARIAFTPGANGGSAITNYEYALSTNGGATYGSFTALSPADASSPIDVTGLANNTTYSIKLRAISANGVGVESSAVSVTTNQDISVDYLVVAGGGGGGFGFYGGGGGAGGLRSTVTATGGGGSLESALIRSFNTNYSVVVGAGGGGGPNTTTAGANGANSVFSTITSVGGGGAVSRDQNATGATGGSGGGVSFQGTPGSGTANQGFAGGTGAYGGSGGGAGAAGVDGADAANSLGGSYGAAGGIGVATTISGSSVYYAGGGGGGSVNNTNGVVFAGGLGGGGAGGFSGGATAVSGTTNTGGGGGGGGGSVVGASGGSGVVILRYPSSVTITISAGLTGSTTTVGANKVTTITAGSGNVSWS